MLTDAARERDFPSLTDRIYLNTAAEGIPPLVVVEALEQYARDKQLGMDGRVLHEAQWDQARRQAAAALGMNVEDIGLCSCSSEAFNLARLALDLGNDDEVVVSDLDFPAGVTPWLTTRSAATVRLWQNRDWMLHADDLAKLLGPRTRLVTLSDVSFLNGFRVDIAAVAEQVRKRSPALIALDVTQALGRVPLRLDNVDLVVSSTHKWVLSTHGGGIVGVPPHRADDWTVPAGGWFNLANAFEADRFESATPKRGAASFSVGMPNYPACYALAAGLGYVNGVGVEAIERHAGPLVRQCLEGLQTMDVELISPKCQDAMTGIIAFRHPAQAFILESLRRRDVHIMGQAGRLRVSVHGYNTHDDIDQFLIALREVLNDAPSS